MRGGLRAACSAVGSLVIVLALAGCADKSWQFWKSSESTEMAPDPAVASAPPAEPAAPTAEPAATAAPAWPAQPAVASMPASNGFAEMPVLPEVRFRSGQVTIGRADRKALESVVRWLKAHPDIQVVIEGHTDDLGTAQANLVVGEKRATSIMRHLIARGIDPGRLSIVSAGSERPVCTEKTTSCRAKNRRARLLVKQP